MGRPLKFATEKEFVEFLMLNAEKWVGDFWGEEIAEIKENCYLQFKKFGMNKPRIDIIVDTKSGRRIGIECKNPKQHFHETSRAVSQLLAYDILAEEQGKPFTDLAILSSSKEDIGFKIIQKFKLPIRVFYIDKEIHGEML